MTWSFSGPIVTPADQHIDAACIYGEEYANGGFCSGIKYSDTTPALWAVWFSGEDVKTWTNATGFANAVDDSANWRTAEDADFTTSWLAQRWLPKDQTSALYYENEYRFTAGDKVAAYSFRFFQYNSI